MLALKTIVTGTILLFIALVAGPYVAVQLDYLAPPLSIGWFRLIGIPMILFGLPFAVWCAYLLIIPGEGHPVPYDSPDGMFMVGPYKYNRNPLMTGWLLVLWGEVIFLKSVPLLFYGIILTLCVHFWIIAYEEPALEDRYGDEYKKYKAQVSRWIPHFRKKD